MNALGFAVAPADFHNVRDPKELKKIAPHNVTGDQTHQELAGYVKIFPELQMLWIKERPLIDEIMERHDATKHRESIFAGGTKRKDPPNGVGPLGGGLGL